jgi:hypothetical protein
MIEINLLPEVKKEFVRTQRTKRAIISGIVLTSIASIALVGILAFYTFVGLPTLQNGADKEIDSLAKSLQSDKNLTRNLTLQNQLAVLPDLHAQKGDFTPLFDIMKSLNPAAPNNVTITKLTIDAVSNTLIIEAKTKDYNGIGVFRDTIKSAKIAYTLRASDGETEKKKDIPLFTDVIFTNVGLGSSDSGQQIASFTVNATYDIDTFSVQASERKVTVPKQKTSPSTENVSLFEANQGGQ